MLYDCRNQFSYKSIIRKKLILRTLLTMDCSTCGSLLHKTSLVSVCCGSEVCSDCYFDETKSCYNCVRKMQSATKCQTCHNSFLDGRRRPVVTMCCGIVLCNQCYDEDQEACCVVCLVSIHSKNKRRMLPPDHMAYQRIFGCRCVILSEDEVEQRRLKRNRRTKDLRSQKKMRAR